MQIDFFCFSVPSLDSTDYVTNKDDDENNIWIKTKELELMNKAKEKGLLIVFDRTTKAFYKDGVEIDISGKVIFPKSIISHEKELLNAIVEKGGISLETIEDKSKIENWPNHVKPLYRFMTLTTFEEFKKNVKSYRESYRQIFLKTARKSNVHEVLESYGEAYIKEINESFFYSKPFIFLPDDEIIILSEVFNNVFDPENDMFCREYRIFVVDGTLASISRSYIDYPTEVPEEVKEFVIQQIERANLIPEFPRSYVFDVAEMIVDGKRVIDIIEYNSLASSGLEVNNDLINDLQDFFPCKSERLIRTKDNVI